MQTLGNLLILVPLLNEQDAILSWVRSETLRLVAAISTAKREVGLLREYRTCLIADVVTGKLDVREAAAQLPDEANDSDPLDDADALSEDDDTDPDAGTEEVEG